MSLSLLTSNTFGPHRAQLRGSLVVRSQAAWREVSEETLYAQALESRPWQRPRERRMLCCPSR